ncbi:MAG: HTH domain-containing protein [Haloarcula sp.]
MQRTGEHAADDAVAGEFAVHLWGRRPICGPRTTVIDRITELNTAGVVDEFEVQTWPEEIPLSEESRHRDLLDTVDCYEQWAIERGLSLRPPFETRTSSFLIGRSKEVLRLPMIVVAAYVDDELVGVYPCSDGDNSWSVTDLIDSLSDGLSELPHETTA